jgi:hypothetical protein
LLTIGGRSATELFSPSFANSYISASSTSQVCQSPTIFNSCNEVEENFEVLQHPPHSPEHKISISSCHLRTFLSEKMFEDQNAVQERVLQYITSLGREHYCEGMFNLVKQCDV